MRPETVRPRGTRRLTNASGHLYGRLYGNVPRVAGRLMVIEPLPTTEELFSLNQWTAQV